MTQPAQSGLARRIVYTLGGSVSIQLIGLVTGIISARLLGVEGRGELAAVLAWSMMVAYVGDFGLPASFAFGAARRKCSQRQYALGVVVLAVLQWLIVAPLGVWVIGHALQHLGSPLVALAVGYLLLLLPMNFVSRCAASLLQGSGRFVAFNVVRLAVPLGYLVALLLLLVRDAGTLENFLWANLFGNALTTLVAIVALLPVLRAEPGAWWPGWSELRARLRFGLSSHIGSLRPLTGLGLDMLVLSALLAPAAAGLYVVAQAIASVIRAQGLAMGMVILPEVAAAVDDAARARAVVRLLRITLWLGLLSVLCLMPWLEWLLALVYGGGFAAAAPLARLLMLAALLSSLQYAIADALRGLHQPLRASLIELLMVIVGLPALLLLVPLWGAIGAAWAVLATALAGLLATVWQLQRSGIDWPQLARVLVPPRPPFGLHKKH